MVFSNNQLISKSAR